MVNIIPEEIYPKYYVENEWSPLCVLWGVLIVSFESKCRDFFFLVVPFSLFGFVVDVSTREGRKIKLCTSEWNIPVIKEE